MRIAIIGAGTMARVHAAALSRIDGVNVVAIAAGEIPPASIEIARQLGADLYSSAAEALARPDVDAVIVATPTDTHHAVVIEAARAGKHIICEKPLARTLEQGEAMLAAVAEAGVKFGVGHVVRYFPEYAAAREMIARGELGTPGVARLTRGAGFPQVAGNWYADVERSGGVVLDMMIHDFDWARWAFGPVERLHAQGLTFSGRPGKDAAMAILRFRSGALAYVEGSWSYPGGFRTTLEVSGSAGLIRSDSQKSAPLSFELAPQPGAEGVAVPSGGLIEDPYLLQLRELIGWLRGGPPPRVTGEDALEALRLGLAALQSIRTGRPITFAAA
ncbi:MAG TPA: Gfo/Idh/MocA family oxidoreductase [Herpetosiphonaceae bacterium]